MVVMVCWSVWPSVSPWRPRCQKFHNNCYHYSPPVWTPVSYGSPRNTVVISSLGTHSRLLLLIIAVQQILNSPFDQTEFKLGSEEGSTTVEDFISSVNGFELMKYSPNSPLQPLAVKAEGEDPGGEDSHKKKRKRRKRRKRKRKLNKNNIKVDQNDTVNLTRPRKIFVSPGEKEKIFQFISRVCRRTRSREVARYCHQSVSRSRPPQPTLLSSILSIF